MRTIAKFATVAALCALLAGCSTFHFQTTLPDGTVIEASHRNFFQSRTLTATTPSGFEITSEVDNKEAANVINNTIEQAAPVAKAAAGGL